MSVLSTDVMNRRTLTTESRFTRTVPFDYVVTVPYGKPGDSTQSLVNISTVGPFIVTGIGYSLLTDERDAPQRFGSIDQGSVEAVRSTLIPLLAAPPAAPIVVVAKASKKTRARKKTRAATDSSTANQFRLFGAPGTQLQVNVDGQPLKSGLVQLDANGRAMLDLSQLQGLASVILTDIKNGRSSPAVTLLPANDSSGRISVTPQFGPLLPQTGAERFDVVATPGAELEAIIRRADSNKARLEQTVIVPDSDDKDKGIESGRVQFDLTRIKRRRTELALVPGDILIVRDTASNLSTRFQVPINPLDVSLRALPATVLRRGFRLDRTLLEKYLDNEILPPPEEARIPFVPCGSDPGELSFLYSIIDNGTGRALQSESIHNIAGLGIADGDRPFRQFPKPFVLDPKSVLLFQVRALSGGPGRLYFVLQGYKVVGASRLRLPGSE